MSDDDLESFYEVWSGKSPQDIEYDINSSMRKADVLTSKIPKAHLAGIKTLLDFGCGYGAVLHGIQERLESQIVHAVGVDFSQAAIDVACKKFSQPNVNYHKLQHLNLQENRFFLEKLFPDGVDAVLLIDLLEHVPDCKALVEELSRYTRFFLIKLPIESTVLDNYILPKEYPSSVHSNGHLREFDVNNVYYFIRTLGLTPLYETHYLYHPDDSFPPLPPGVTTKQRLARLCIKALKVGLSCIMGK